MDKTVQEVLAHHEKDGNLISILKDIQDERMYLTNEIMKDIAEGLGITLGEVYEIATFYSFLSTEPLGKNVIRVCKSTPCFLKNYEFVVKAVEKDLGIKPGEITEDGKFSLHLTNCIGACDESPAMMINKKRYGNLTPDKIAQILSEYK